MPAVIELFAAERWSYADEEERTWRALTAPGSLTLVAVSDDVVGIAQVVSDGEIQAFLSVLLVAKDHRQRGIGRRLVEEAMAQSKGLRLDVICCADPFYEALGFSHTLLLHPAARREQKRLDGGATRLALLKERQSGRARGFAADAEAHATSGARVGRTLLNDREAQRLRRGACTNGVRSRDDKRVAPRP